MPAFVPKRYEQILTHMIARVVSQTDLSDVADSSAYKHVLAATARSHDELYYQASLLRKLFDIDEAVGEDLDERAAEIQPGTVKRKKAVKATGTVIFSRSGTLGAVTIPSGTKVKTPDGKVFSTTSSATINPGSSEQIPGHGVGRDSVPVPAQADAGGSAGNVAAGTISKFSSKPAGVDEVTNLVSFLGGADKELDDDFRGRLKRYIAGLARCPRLAIEANLEGQVDPATGKIARLVKVLEDTGTVTVYVDDGSGSSESTANVVGEVVIGSAVGGELYLTLDNIPLKPGVAATLTSSSRGALVEGVHYRLVRPWGRICFLGALTAGEQITASYTHYTGLLQYIQKLVDGDPNDRANFPGLRAAGVVATVQTPQIVIQSVLASIVVADGYDAPTVKGFVKEAVLDYINGLGISGDIIRNRLIQVIMAIPGVANLNLITPATDIIVLDDQLARTTATNVTIN